LTHGGDHGDGSETADDVRCRWMMIHEEPCQQAEYRQAHSQHCKSADTAEDLPPSRVEEYPRCTVPGNFGGGWLLK